MIEVFNFETILLIKRYKCGNEMKLGRMSSALNFQHTKHYKDQIHSSRDEVLNPEVSKPLFEDSISVTQLDTSSTTVGGMNTVSPVSCFRIVVYVFT